MCKKNNRLLVVLCILSSILALIPVGCYFYISELGKLSRENADWDTFSFLISACFATLFSGISTILLLNEYIRNRKKDRDEEKERTTNHLIESLLNLNDLILENGKILLSPKPKTVDLLFKTINKEILFNIYAWCFIYELNEGIDIMNFPKIKATFKNNTELQSFLHKLGHEQLRILKTNIKSGFTDEQVNSIINNYPDPEADITTKLRSINECSVQTIINSSKLADELNTFIYLYNYSLEQIGDYKEGQILFFLNLSFEQKYFLKLASLDGTIKIMDEIKNTDYAIKDNDYELLLSFLGRK